MYVWDCAPEELTAGDLMQEMATMAKLWPLVHQHRLHAADHAHHEVMRFGDRPFLLVARNDFLRFDAADRKLVDDPAVHRLADAKFDDVVITERETRMYVTEEYDDWYAFRVHANWPTYGGRYRSPWEHRNQEYEQYRHSAGEEAVQMIPPLETE